MILENATLSATVDVPVLRPHEARRRELFREPTRARVLRWSLALAYVLQPKRLADAPALGAGVLRSLLRGGVVLPSEADIQARPDSFAGVARHVTPESLVEAHRAGFFPQAHFGPLKWWTRSRRYMLPLAERQVPKRLKPLLRKSKLTVSFDRAFDEVIAACAEPRPGRPRLTWITPRIKHLYAELHDRGIAHSFELWDENGALVGGGYGVAIGRVFVTESLFSRVPNASKLGLQALHHHLAAWGYHLNDVKDHAAHFDNCGFRYVDRKAYEAMLREHATGTSPGSWRAEAQLQHLV
ncbi:MAG: leucyl/phenylalanyl-tRNA--protein transferase [Proteobacteria bacterium]|nr:leucyl/phenylalanyl-tRNA--protein transferase [Pseudomonadota bacterium]